LPRAVAPLTQVGARWIGIANRIRSRAGGLLGDFQSVFPGTSFASSSLAPADSARVPPRIDPLVNPSVLGFKGEEGGRLWIGRIPPSGVMKERILAALGGR